MFPVPPRLALAPLTYEEINLASKGHCGKGVSKQAFHLLPKIRETEALLGSSCSDNFDWLKPIRSSASVVLMGPYPWSILRRPTPAFASGKPF